MNKPVSRPMASLSLDVDNLWSYMKIHGDEGWQDRPSYLDTFIPYMLEVLERAGVKITFFIVGIDAAREENHGALRSIVQAGHEVGNHSHEHEPWLHEYSPQQVREELISAHRAIEQASGQTPEGFRGPGFSWSPDVLLALHELGYRYDASTLPTWLGPIARTYYFWSAKLTPEERERRKGLFGQWADGRRPVAPYWWTIGDQQRLLEIPVTTIPVFRTPFHFSYLAYLARFSRPLMFAYLKIALSMCRLTGVEPSFLLHPLDVIGGDKAPQLAFFPGMDLPSEKKTELLLSVLAVIGRHFQLVPMGEHARACEARASLPTRVPA
ncbi:MAG: polysaccharide deacetylase family protein [Burkholderiaceae bacterium]